MNRLYIICLIIISAIWSNARMLDHLAGYTTFHIFDLAREFRFFEVGFVSLFFLIAYSKFTPASNEERFVHLTAPWFVVVLGLMSGLLNGVGILDIFQGIYLFLSPLLVYYTALWMRFGEPELKLLRKSLTVLLVVSAPAWLYQVVTYFFFDGNGDNVNGLLSDSHLYANIEYCVVLFAVSGFVIRRSYTMLVAGGVIYFMAFFSLNEKSLLFMIPLLFLIFLFGRAGEHRRSVLVPIALGTMLLLGLFSIARNLLEESNSELRANVLLENKLSDLGTVMAYLQLPQVFEEAPRALFYGVGAGNYGSSMAIRRQLEGTASDLSEKYVGDFAFAGRTGAFSWKTNYLIGMVVEYGIVFTILVVAFYGSLIRNLMHYVSSRGSGEISTWSLSIIASLLLIWMTALVSNISNLDEGILIYPIMIAAASVQTIAEAEARRRSV